MAGFLELQIDDYHGVLSEFAATEGQVKTASRRAVSKTVDWAAIQIGRTIAAEDRVPIRQLTKGGAAKGQRIFKSKPGKGHTTGSIWVGSNPIRAAYLGKLSQLRAGARAGKVFFNRSFLATMKSGHQSVYIRKGKTRLPIIEQTHPLHSADAAVAETEQRGYQRLHEILGHELNYEVNVIGS